MNLSEQIDDIIIPKIMALIESNSHVNSLVKGDQLVAGGKVKLLQYDVAELEFTYEVQSQYSNGKYSVWLKLNDEGIYADCNCPYNYGGFCKHIIASMKSTAQKLLSRQVLPYTNQAGYSFQYSNLSPAEIEKYNKGYPGITYKEIDTRGTKIVDYAEGLFKFLVPDVRNGGKMNVQFTTRKESTVIDSNCNCEEKVMGACIHKLIALKKLALQHGEYAIQDSFDWTAEKSRILHAYGYELTDDYHDVIRFHFNGSGLKHSVVPGFLSNSFMDQFSEDVSNKLLPAVNDQDNAIGIALNICGGNIPLVQLTFFNGKMLKSRKGFRSINRVLVSDSGIGSFFDGFNEEYYQLYSFYQQKLEPDSFKRKLPFIGQYQNDCHTSISAKLMGFMQRGSDIDYDYDYDYDVFNNIYGDDYENEENDTFDYEEKPIDEGKFYSVCFN